MRNHREQRREKHTRRHCRPGVLSLMAIVLSLRPRGTSPFTNTADLHFRPSLVRFPFAACQRLRSYRTPRTKCFDTSLRLLSEPGLLRRAIDASLSPMLTLRPPLARSRPRDRSETRPLCPILSTLCKPRPPQAGFHVSFAGSLHRAGAEREEEVIGAASSEFPPPDRYHQVRRAPL